MVTSMLEKAIEIEGLIRIIRDGNPAPETYTLLNKKIAELSELAAGIDCREHEHETVSAKVDFVMAPAPSEEQIPEVNFTEKPQIIPADSDLTTDDLSNISEEEEDMAEEDDIILEFDDSEEVPAEMPTEVPETNEPSAIVPEESEQIAIEQEEPEQIAIEPQPEPTEPAEEEPKGVENPPIAQRQTKLKSLFSLNDRFLYARELFNGNMKMFDSTLDFLEGMHDYTDVEDYFYSELEWNPEKQYVAQFMEILRPHFKE